MLTRLAPVSAPPAARVTFKVAVAGLIGAFCVAPTLVDAGLSTAEDFNAGLSRVAAELRVDQLACDKLSGHARDVCRDQARGKEAVVKAELVLAHTGTQKSLNNLTTARLDAAYDVARTMCNGKAGSAKAACTQQAQAVRTKGFADMKTNQRITDARGDRREADYKLAAEKCGAMAVDARAGCLAAAKAKAGGT